MIVKYVYINFFFISEHSMSLNEFRATCEELQATKRSSRESIENVSSSSFKRFREDTERLDIIAVIRRFEEDQVPNILSLTYV